PFPSGSAQRLQDWTAKGLAELGHDVVYCITNEVLEPPPPGVKIVDRLDPHGVDAAHTFAIMPWFESALAEAGVPYISSVHVHPQARPGTGAPQDRKPERVYVSRWLAGSVGSTRFVRNGVDPAEYTFSAAKERFLLFMTSMDWAMEKGIETAIAVARRSGMRLVVAGGARQESALERTIRMCDVPGVEYVGDMQGEDKRALLANAAALIHPSRYAEACPLTILEAMVSGTPVLATPSGGTPELMSEEVGFLCNTDDEFVQALEKIGTIDPHACRARALRDFHYRRMAGDYVREYEAAMAAVTKPFTTVAAQSSS
ncbi:MAG TPA: glycosyltransferase, partial [Thermoanaerobaculia bacterium]|nr:glycosyltransferase [Thermoanaerobaculia bacterium]